MLDQRAAAADADHQPPAAQMVEHADFFIEPQRMVQRQHIDQRAEPERLVRAKAAARNTLGLPAMPSGVEWCSAR